MAPLPNVKGETDSEIAASLYRRVIALQPRIEAAALTMEKAGRPDDALIAALDDAGAFSILVPKRWGGAGLGLAEAGEVLRLIAQVDCSTAWNTSFYMLNNMLLCRFPEATQAEVYARKPSYTCAGIWAPMGKATRVAGGYHLTGKWGYASGVYQADAVILPALLDGVAHWFIAPKPGLTVFDDWQMTGLAATGSATVAAQDLFIAEGHAMPIARLISPTDHYGVDHPGDVHRYPFVTMSVLSTALAVGALESAIAISRDKLGTSKPYGISRLDRAPARMRWAEAAQKLRLISLLRDDAMALALERGARGHAWSLADLGQQALDTATIYHTARDALRMLTDNLGSSLHKADETLQRKTRDLTLICTHLLMGDYDVIWERASRWVLGLGLAAGDPGA